MTSPTEPPKESLRDRISHRLSTDGRGRHIDADAQHTRNVTLVFYALIVVTLVIVIGALAFGFWEANLKPLASVEGSEVSRGQMEDRKKLEQFRAERAASQVSTALAEGTIEADLAERRFANIEATAPTTDAQVLTDLVDLLYKEKLASEEGIELDEAELEEALANQGGFDESRLIEALVILTAEQQAGGISTEAGIADARARAEAAVAELEAGADYETLAETYGPAQAESAYITADDILDAAWSEAIFAAEEGGITGITQGASGEQLIALVRTIAPAETDPDFSGAAFDEVGEGIVRRNVELEALAAKLEEQVTSEVLEAEYPQVRLAQIFVERSTSGSDDSEGEVRASHILYAPETPLADDGNPTAVADLAEDDPAWAEAEAEARRAAGELLAVEDVEARMEAFASRARVDSDGPSSVRGGDLGWFQEGAMVTEFDEAIWQGIDLQRGDILGPVRTDFGWHVILFDQFRSSFDVRLAEVQAALAEEGADFAAVAAELSDGAEASEGGDIGWRLIEDLDDELVVALVTLATGGITEPIDEGDGAHIYQKLEEATRPLDPADATERAATAFSDWYDERYFEALDDGDISIDEGIYG